MAAKENPPASATVWYFIAAVFLLTLPGMLFPDLSWWARVAAIAVGGALIAIGIGRLRNEASDPDDRSVDE
ncbi:hypothetical protein ACIPVB_03075 [Microbacterium sp. NPDC090007]|uniref:hypothetical protein n=1 Tax=Microbacterium sp. NPDC090007 TaxID=3364204 RepID=UPI0037F26614